MESLLEEAGEMVRAMEVKALRKNPDGELGLDPDSITVHQYTGMARSLLQRGVYPAKAVALANQALEREPTNAYA